MRPVLTAAALALTSCGTIAEAPARSVNPTVTLIGAPTSATEGQSLPLSVTLTNTTTSTVTYQGNTCPYNVFEVMDLQGTVIDPRIELIFCLAYTETITLAPGQSKEWNVAWLAQRYPAVNRPLPPVPTTSAKVRIRARYWINGTTEVGSAWKEITVRAP